MGRRSEKYLVERKEMYCVTMSVETYSVARITDVTVSAVLLMENRIQTSINASTTVASNSHVVTSALTSAMAIKNAHHASTCCLHR